MTAVTLKGPFDAASEVLRKSGRKTAGLSSGSKSNLERGTTKLQIVLGQTSIQRLDAMKEFVEPSTRAEVFRTSLRVLDDIIEELKKGNEFLMRDRNGNIHPYNWSIS
jgi:hypothetical protein